MTTLQTTGDELIDEIRSVWTHGADGYDLDAGHGLMTPVVEDAWLAVLERLLGTTPREVLDVGAGTGFLSVLAARLGHRVTAVDLTPAMLERAEERARMAGVTIRCVEGNAMDLPFEDDEFEVVVSRHVLWTMTEPEQAFREWIRVTRAGGEVTWFDGLKAKSTPVAKVRGLAASAVTRIQRPVDHAHSHHYDAELVAHLPFRGLESTQPIRETLERIGVRDVSCRALPRLQKAERSMLERSKRLRPGSTRYVGRFPVTLELKERVKQAS